MRDVLVYLISYLVLINLAGFILMGIDKIRAKRRIFRIPEATIFTAAIFGGSIGAWLGVYVFDHKSRHWYFTYGLPLILLLQVIGVLALFYYIEPSVL